MCTEGTVEIIGKRTKDRSFKKYSRPLSRTEANRYDFSAVSDRNSRSTWSESDPWGRVNALEHRLFGGARGREAGEVAKDANAASRAAAATAAHMRVRDVVEEARLEHAEAEGPAMQGPEPTATSAGHPDSSRAAPA
jgi:hypothetical protein